MKLAKRTVTSNPCRAIGHYTDAVGELEVAAMQAHQAGDRTLADRLHKLRDKAFSKQKGAIAACVRKKR